MKNRKIFFFVSALSVLVVLYVTSRFSNGTTVSDLRMMYSSTIVTPLEFYALAVTAASGVLLFFNKKIFLLWLHKFFLWFVLVSILAIYSIGGGGGMLSPSHSDVALLLGQVMVGATLIFALTARFYFKLK
jgi:hypothetical protein